MTNNKEKNLIPAKVRGLAKKWGFPSVTYEGEWKVYAAYGPYYPPINGREAAIGLLILVFQKGNEYLVSTPVEAFSCVDDLCPD